MRLTYRTVAAVWAAALMLACAEGSAARAGETGSREAGGPQAGKTVVLDLSQGVTLELVLIRPGSFMMGSTLGDDEQPVHKVTVTRPFYLGKSLVTQEQWKAVTGANPSVSSRGPQNPVDSVTWLGCEKFLAKLNAKFEAPGVKFSLPTEAQWEYACRAGSKGIFHFGDAEERLGDYAWFSDNAAGKPHPVGLKKPNAWGLYDMYGNVWQWCADWYAADYYRKSPAADPAGPAVGAERVMRGGSWYRGALDCRSANRYRGVAACPDYANGLRVARTAPEIPATPDSAK